jgi:hypothetical protein
MSFSRLSHDSTVSVCGPGTDDVLVERLVLNGGNALELAHRIGQRASLDLYFSIEGDFDDPNAIGERLHAALIDRFDAVRLQSIRLCFQAAAIEQFQRSDVGWQPQRRDLAHQSFEREDTHRSV